MELGSFKEFLKKFKDGDGWTQPLVTCLITCARKVKIACDLSRLGCLNNVLILW
jgi:hypothetical protein